MKLIDRMKMIQQMRSNGDTWEAIAADLGWKHGYQLQAYYKRHADRVDDILEDDFENPSSMRDMKATDAHLQDLLAHHKPGTGELNIGHDPLMTGHTFRRELNYSVTGSHFA